jgi:3-hydroxyacyl-CoA dehydrogenase
VSSVVNVIREGPVGVIQVNVPPVNALSQSVRAGLLDAISRLDADPAVEAAVLICQGRTFIAGADVTEMDQPPNDPQLPDVTARFERASKPVVAAIHGTALGGGFELALACHYRLAVKGATVGFPEVKLGLIPGAGGTQRLPRLVGVARALQMITEGAPVPVEVAREWGAIDKVLDATEASGVDLQAAAIAAARSLAHVGGPLRRVGSLGAPERDAAAFDAAARGLEKKARGQVAPLRAVDAVRAATELTFEEGLRREREIFLELRASPQSAALRYAFLGEREVSKPPGLPAETKVRPVQAVGIVGAGTMGTGIAMCFANAGIPVTVLDADAAALERGLETIRRTYASSVARGSLSQAEMDRRLGRVQVTSSFADFGHSDLIIEAVFEDIDVKKRVFQELDAVAKPGAILATNTSYLDVATMAGFTGRPQDVIGLHFFSPANVMRLLEVVRTPAVARDVVATAMHVGKALGKVAVLVGGADGFVGNRMLAQRTREAYFLLEEGALPEQVDRVLTEFGFPMGPFVVGDLAGLDIGWRNRKARAHLRKPSVRDCNLLDKVCELGRLGQKTGAGWYRYDKGSRTPIPDPVVEQLIVEHSKAAGIPRRAITDAEILDRCLFSMINEGGKILEEGVAVRELDIDMVWLHGYGFPAYRGGPMYFARTTGFEAVVRRLREFEARFGPEFWTPSGWLIARAAGP